MQKLYVDFCSASVKMKPRNLKFESGISMNHMLQRCAQSQLHALSFYDQWDVSLYAVDATIHDIMKGSIATLQHYIYIVSSSNVNFTSYMYIYVQI